MIRRQKIKRIEKEKKTFKREYIPLIFAVLFLIALIVALVYAIMYKPEKTIINELYSMSTEELPVNVNNVACTNEVSNMIGRDANNIKVRYEELSNYVLGKTFEVESDINGDGELGEIDDIGFALRVTISGITENVYLRVENDIDYNIEYYGYDETDNGVITFDQIYNAYVRTYNVKVYSENDECGGILYREFNFTLPRMNDLSLTPLCENHKELATCKTFVFDKDGNKMFDEYKQDIAKVDEEYNKNKEKENKNIMDYINEYKLYVIIGVVLLFAGVVVIIVKRRR